jgi:hypothetical protein
MHSYLWTAFVARIIATMTSIRRFVILAGGAPTGIHETMMALVNMNIDFSVVRYEARPEIQEVGNRLWKRRKIEAEDGKTHHTARRLGALFAFLVRCSLTRFLLLNRFTRSMAFEPPRLPPILQIPLRVQRPMAPLLLMLALMPPPYGAAATSGPGSVYLLTSSIENRGIAFPLEFISECMKALPLESLIIGTYL